MWKGVGQPHDMIIPSLTAGRQSHIYVRHVCEEVSGRFMAIISTDPIGLFS
jgi:hypothetical protein